MLGPPSHPQTYFSVSSGAAPTVIISNTRIRQQYETRHVLEISGRSMNSFPPLGYFCGNNYLTVSMKRISGVLENAGIWKTVKETLCNKSKMHEPPSSTRLETYHRWFPVLLVFWQRRRRHIRVHMVWHDRVFPLAGWCIRRGW